VGDATTCPVGKACTPDGNPASVGTSGTCQVPRCATDGEGASCRACQALCILPGGACEAEHTALRTCVDAKAPESFCYPTLPQSGAPCAVPSACLELLDAARGCAQAWSDHACS
jgi:hypothetical protein